MRSHEAVIEDGHPGRLEGRPPISARTPGALVVPSPGPHDVAVPDELHAAPAEHLDRAAEQAVDDQEPAGEPGRLVCGGRVPLPG